MEQQGGPGVGRQFAPLGALQVGVEDEAGLVEALQQHGARIGQALGVDRGEGHGVGICRFRPPRLRQPVGEQREGIGLPRGHVLLGGVGLIVGLAGRGRDQALAVGIAAHGVVIARSLSI